MNDDLLSFVIAAPEPDYGDEGPPDIEPGSINDKLLKAITTQVKKDGIRKSAILTGETAGSVLVNASENIYYDVSEYFYWYFEPGDPRYKFMTEQKKATILSPLRAAVKPVVEQVLADMIDAEMIPEGQESEALEESISDNLTRYILNWQDWYYERKEQEALEEHFEALALYRDIYIDSEYGDLTNIDNYLDSDVDDLDGFGNVAYKDE